MYSTFFKPFPELQTERLLLRKVKKSDLEDLYEYCRSPISAKYAEWTPHEDITVTKQYISWLLSAARHGQYMTWCIVLKESGKVIGTCSFTEMDNSYKVAEIGYGLSRSYWGNGYATEAANAVMNYGFCTIGLVRIYARVMKENLASVRLASRIGMQCDGLLRKGIYCKSAYHDIYVYGITDDDYRIIIDAQNQNGQNKETEKPNNMKTEEKGNISDKKPENEMNKAEKNGEKDEPTEKQIKTQSAENEQDKTNKIAEDNKEKTAEPKTEENKTNGEN